MVSAEDGKRIGDFTKALKAGYSKCLDPTMQCAETAIKAHTVQNATAMSFIEENGHVSTVRVQLRNGEPACRFAKVGRNDASTFTGLCGRHDTEMFKPIDTKELSLDDSEQLFLIAWRAVTRELHATLEGASRIQSTYLKMVADEKFRKEKRRRQ